MKLSGLAFTLLGLAAAAPIGDLAPTGTIAPPATLVARDDTAFASVTTWSGNNCRGSSAMHGVGTVKFTCFEIPGGSFAHVFGEVDCTLTTWSGTNCRGSSLNYDMEDLEDDYDGCHAVQFGSYSINCGL
ncbi:hypothetical protein LTR08_009014 [Meristemomyces frigidus]|nr:hypothetical protein LTR08_009014 [Meristemomyces frigidus]